MINYKVLKPIYGLNIAIRDTILNRAIEKKTSIRATYNDEAYIIDPKKWIKTGDRMEKVYLIPDQPMILYQNHLSRFPLEVKEEDTTPLNVMNKLAETQQWEKLRKILH